MKEKIYHSERKAGQTDTFLKSWISLYFPALIELYKKRPESHAVATVPHSS